jgi:hypothetical protein
MPGVRRQRRTSIPPGRAVFDDPNLVSHGGLVPVVALAERAGLPELLAKRVRPGGGCGVNTPLKVGCLMAGMAAGAGSIDDMGLLRHGRGRPGLHRHRLRAEAAYGHKKQSARFGHTKIQGKSVLVRGLNALITAVSTPLSAPVTAATRLRGGNAPSARGAKASRPRPSGPPGPAAAPGPS